MVGTILILINYDDTLWHGGMDPNHLFKMGLTVIVPYVVSTVSSVSTMMEANRAEPERAK